MLPKEDIKEGIMRRIYVVYFMRKLVYPAIAEAVTLAGLAAAFVSFVSFNNVVQNAMSVVSVSAFMQYALSALMQTEVFMQIVLAAGIGVSAFFMYKILHTVREVRGEPIRA